MDYRGDNASAIQNMNADYIIYQSDTDYKLSRSALSWGKLDEIKQ